MGKYGVATVDVGGDENVSGGETAVRKVPVAKSPGGKSRWRNHRVKSPGVETAVWKVPVWKSQYGKYRNASFGT